MSSDERGKLQVRGDPDHPVNRGMLCSKGLNLHYSVMDRSDRLLSPQIRDTNGDLRDVSWDAALDRVASDFRGIIEKHGPDSVGFYVSGQLLTEEYYIINKLTKGFLQTNNIDTNSRLCMSSAVVGYKKALGEDSVPISYDDIELADVFLIAGANPAWCHPIIYRRLEAHRASHPDVRVIAVDPRKTETCQDADLHLQLNPGTDTYLFHAIAREIIENGWIDEQFIKNHTEGFEELRSRVFSVSTEECSRICGIPQHDIRLAAQWIGHARGFLTLWAMGLNQSTVGVNKNLALLNLSLITGHIGKPGSGPFSLTGQPNAMGGREVGGLSNLLPAHRDLANAEHRAEVAKFWKVGSVPEKPGLTATEMFEELRCGDMKAVWIVCTNPTTSLPDARTVEAGLRRAELVVVQDISRNSGAIPFAHVVLPAAGWIEKQGTMTNSDRRITYLPKIIDPPGNAKPDSWIIQRFAEKMGWKQWFNYASEEEIFKEHAELTRGTRIDIHDLDYEQLRTLRSVQWPRPGKHHPGTERLFGDGVFYRPGGRARIFGVEPEDTAERPTPEHPLILTTGRIRDQWHTMTRTGKVQRLREHRPEPFLEIHPEDARQRNIEDGHVVEVSGLRGTVHIRAQVTDSIKAGVVFLPMHWGRNSSGDSSRANNLTSKKYDPTSKQPGYKSSIVEVRPHRKEKDNLLIVGGGNATLAFVRKYRSLVPEDKITVLCKEADSFYNRILLPDLISGAKEFAGLAGLTESERAELGIEVLTSTEVTRIRPSAKEVYTGNEIFSYNKLILAPGSRPSLPEGTPSLQGIFSLRSRLDAERIKRFFVPDTDVAIVGGGLLALELAAALRSRAVNVTLLVRGTQLMSRQLDEVGASILHDEVLDRGIRIRYNEEIKEIKGKERIQKVILKSGNSMEPDGVVFAVGTRPNDELAHQAGLEIAESGGVVVNEFLQSSDPDIFVLGEAAQFQGTVYGTVRACQDQAEVAAWKLFGYVPRAYTGSIHLNILKIPGVNLASIRRPEASLSGENGEESITFLDRTRRKYKKCLIKDDRLVGAILVGDTGELPELQALMTSGLELGERRDQLLSGSPPKVVEGKLICSCHSVGEGNIEQAIREGADSLESLGRSTAAGTGCGSCRSELSQILRGCQEKASGAPERSDNLDVNLPVDISLPALANAVPEN